jgi:3-hydroxybutyryl-CoA dehydrogenase
MAEGLRHADRFVGMHFFNPAPVMRLVELVAGPATSEQSMVAGRSICAKLNKTAVAVKDSPGFICNRVNRPFYLEAQHLLESGEADIDAIDQAVKDVGGFKMGPFEVMDLVGLDVNQTVTETVYRGFGQAARFAPSAVQRDLVARGHLGRKTGRGFYDYSVEGSPVCEHSAKARPSWQPSSALVAFAAALDRPADRATWLYARIMLAVIQEAALVAESVALPRSVDVAMELGLGYPQGPLGLADHVGLDVVLSLLSDFRAAEGASERFKPSPLLERHVADGHLGEESARGFFHHAL